MTSIYIRTLLMYLLLVAVIRLLGKRQVGQMEPSEFVVTMLIANLATAAIDDPEAPVLFGVLPILIILGAELTLSWLTLRSMPMRRLLCGKPVILIENGNLVQANLKKTRVTLDELTSKLREKDVLDLTTVRYAILETNGTLSVFLYPGDRPATAKEAGIRAEPEVLPLTIIEDGVLLGENLVKSGRTENWVRGLLRERGAETGDTLLLTVDENNHVVFIRKEEVS